MLSMVNITVIVPNVLRTCWMDMAYIVSICEYIHRRSSYEYITFTNHVLCSDLFMHLNWSRIIKAVSDDMFHIYMYILWT